MNEHAWLEKALKGDEETEPVPIIFVNYHGTVGGGQKLLLTLLDGLNRNRWQPHVVCCQKGIFLDLLRQRGIEAILIPFGKAKWRYFFSAASALFRFYRLLKAKSARLVHVCGLQEAKLAAWPCAWARVPMVWVVAP